MRGTDHDVTIEKNVKMLIKISKCFQSRLLLFPIKKSYIKIFNIHTNKRKVTIIIYYISINNLITYKIQNKYHSIYFSIYFIKTLYSFTYITFISDIIDSAKNKITTLLVVRIETKFYYDIISKIRNKIFYRKQNIKFYNKYSIINIILIQIITILHI